MAQYTDEVTLKNFLPHFILQQMTDDNDTDEIDHEKLDYAIEQASNVIDSYLRGRYALPLTTVPAEIVDLCTKLSAYYLFKRSLPETIPEALKTDYRECISMLRDIQKGISSPFIVADNPTWFVSNKHNPTSVSIPDRSIPVTNAATNNWQSYLI